MNRRTFLQKGSLIGGAFLAGTPFFMPHQLLRGPLARVERIYISMGTTVRFLVFHEDEREALHSIHEAQALVQRVHRLMSVQEPHSELSRWNNLPNGLDGPFDRMTAEALDEAILHTVATGGCFDPLVGTEVGRSEWRKVVGGPSSYLEAWDASERRFEKVHPDARIDLGGSAKGWAVDRAVEIIQTRGASAALVNAGGDLRVLGAPAGEEGWRIGIRDPLHPDERLCTLNLNDCSVATSGSYASDGSTILDPGEGSPVTFSGSATVIAPSCGAADCWSTALCVNPDLELPDDQYFPLIARIGEQGLHIVRRPAEFILDASLPP